MKLLVVSPDAGRLEALRAAAAAQASVSSLAVLAGSLAQRPDGAVDGSSDAILLDATQNPMAELDALEQLQETKPAIQAVLLVASDEPGILRRAMRLGVKDVLTPDTIEGELASALLSMQEACVVRSEEKAKTLVFVSAKGGSGATFLAANFAYNLASQTGKRVMLMDLDLRGGNAHLMLTERRPLVHIADLAREIHRVDLSFLKSSMIDILPGLGILAAPEDSVLAGEVRTTHIETLVELARSNFDYVVIDIGRAITPITVRALDVADYVYPVCQLSVPFIRETRRLVQALRALDMMPAKIKLVVNRHEKVRDLKLEDLEKAVGIEVAATIPNDYKNVSEAVNHGTALASLAKGSPVNKALVRLMHEITDNGAGKSSWLSRVLNR